MSRTCMLIVYVHDLLTVVKYVLVQNPVRSVLLWSSHLGHRIRDTEWTRHMRRRVQWGEDLQGGQVHCSHGWAPIGRRSYEIINMGLVSVGIYCVRSFRLLLVYNL